MSNTPSSLEIINITGSFDTTTKKFVSLKINNVDFEEKQPKLNLIECVKAGNLENVKKCLAENQDPNMTDICDRNALCISVCLQNKKIVEELVNAGANILTVSPTHQLNMLNYSAAAKSLELVQYFIDKKLDINQQDKVGDTPLHNAIIGGLSYTFLKSEDVDLRIKILKLLLDAGADYNLKNHKNMTVLQTAKRTSGVRITDFLKQYIKEKKQSVLTSAAPTNNSANLVGVSTNDTSGINSCVPANDTSGVSANDTSNVNYGVTYTVISGNTSGVNSGVTSTMNSGVPVNDTSSINSCVNSCVTKAQTAELTIIKNDTTFIIKDTQENLIKFMNAYSR